MNNSFESYMLPFEQQMNEQIYNALQGDVIQHILNVANYPMSDSYSRSMLEGHSFKVEEKTLPHYYRLFNEVKERLGFEYPVDFYISGDASVNAFAISSPKEGEPHIMNINSSLIDLMTEEELQFVVGHELGHIINKHSSLLRLINFVYAGNRIPHLALQYKIRLWQQLAELVADRFGFLAMPKREVCVSAFFKMSSGLDFDKMKMNVDAFIEDNINRLEFFKNDQGMNLASHPVNPIRVQALNLFSRSELFVEGGTSKDDLQKQMDELTSILLKLRNQPIDFYLAQYLATAGIVIAYADQKVREEEVDAILNELAGLHIFPKSYLENLAKQDVNAIFQESVEKILETNPEYREGLLRYLMGVAMSDKNIHQDEVDVVFSIAQQLLGFQPMETSRIFADMIQKMFEPGLDAMV